MKLNKFFIYIKKPLCKTLIVIILWPSMPNFGADIVVKDTDIFIDHTATGTDIVYIKQPNNDDLSYNAFEKFNVDQPGAIINNSVNGDHSYLAGNVAGNPFLQGNEASAVVFDVLGGQQSQINGYLEMIGKPADFILSNEKGVFINGGGFLNMSKVLLTTGRALDETYQTYAVRQGGIQIGEHGLYAAGIDHLDLASRFVTLEGQLKAGQTLRVAAGIQHITLAGDIDPVLIENNIQRSAQYAIDASLLGGISAGSIYLVSSEAGLGVRSNSILKADSGEVNIRADGDILLNQVMAKNVIDVKTSADIVVGISEPQRIVMADEIVFQSGQNQDFNQTQLLATDIKLYSKGHIQVDESVFMGGVIQLNGEQEIVVNNSMLMTSDHLKMQSNEKLHVENTRLQSPKIEFFTHDFSQIGGDIHAGSLNISSIQRSRLNAITTSGNIVVEDELSLSANDISLSGALSVLNDLKINAGFVTQNANLGVAKNLEISAEEVLNTGHISSLGVTLNTKRLTQKGLLKATENLQLHLDEFVQSGSIMVANDLMIDSAHWDNEGFIHVGGHFLNRSEYMANLNTISADSMDIQSQNFLNNGFLAAKKNLNFFGHHLLNEGYLYSKGHMDIDSQYFHNNSLFQGDETVDVDTQLLKNTAIIKGENVAIDARILENSGDLLAGQFLQVQSQLLENHGRVLVLGNGGLEIDSTVLRNDMGMFISNSDITLNLDADYVINGVFHALNLLDISAFSIQNYADLKANQSVLFKTTRGDFVNHEQAIVQSQADIRILAAQNIINEGSMVAVSDIHLFAGAEIQNKENSYMLSDSNMLLSAKNFYNEGGLYFMGEGQVSLENSLSNSGDMVFMQNLLIDAKFIMNQYNILSGHDFLIQADSLKNTGRLQSAHDLKLIVNNIENGMASVNYMQTNASTSHGFRQVYDTVNRTRVLDTWSSDRFWKRKGNKVYIEETLLVDKSDADYHDEILIGTDTLESYQKGEILAGHDLDIIGDYIHNQASDLRAQNNLYITGELANESIVLNDYFHHNKVRRVEGFNGIKYTGKTFHHQWRKWNGSTTFRKQVASKAYDQLNGMWETYSYQTATSKEQYNSLVQAGGDMNLVFLNNYFSDHEHIKENKVQRLEKEHFLKSFSFQEFTQLTKRQQQLLDDFQNNGFLESLNFLHLPEQTRYLKSPTILAHDLMVNGTVNNAGDIFVNEVLVFQSIENIVNHGYLSANLLEMKTQASIIHKGGLQSSNRLLLQALGDIYFDDASIESKGVSYLSAKKSVLFKGVNYENKYDFKQFNFEDDVIVSAGNNIEIHQITDTEPFRMNMYFGRNLQLEAGNNILIHSAQMDIEKSALIQAGALVNIDAEDHLEDGVSSLLFFKENLNIISGEDVVLNGSLIDVGGRAQFDIAGHLLLKARKPFLHGKNIHRFESVIKKQPFLGSQLIVKNDFDLSIGKDLQLEASKLFVGAALNADIDNNIDLNAISRETGNGQTYKKHWYLSEFSVGDDMRLSTGGDVRNEGVIMKVGGSGIFDIAGKLELLALAEETGSKKGDKAKYTKTHRQANLDIGGHLHLKTGDSVTLKGSQIKVGGQAQLESGGDLKLLAVKDENYTKETHVRKKRWYRRGKTSVKETYNKNSIGSVIDIKDQSLATVEGNMLLEGSEINLAAHGRWNIAKDLVLLNALNDSSKRDRVEYSHWSHGKVKDKGKVTQREVKSRISSKGALQIEAGASIAQVGSDISSDLGLRLSAEKDIYIGNASKEEKEWDYSQLSVLGVYEKENRSDKSSSSVIDSNTETALSLALEAGENIAVVGSHISAGEHAFLDAGDDISFKAAIEKMTETRYSRKKTLDVSSLETKIEDDQIKAGISYNETEHRQTTSNQTLYAASLSAGGSIQSNSGGSTIIEASDIRANGDISIEAKDDVVIRSADELLSTEEVKKDNRLYVGVAIGNAFVDLGRSIYELAKGEKNDATEAKLAQEAEEEGLQLEKDKDAEKVSEFINQTNKIVGTVSKTARVVADVSRSAVSAAQLGFYAQVETKKTSDINTQHHDEKTARASTIQSLNGDVSIVAGNKLAITGSDVAAMAGDIELEGIEIELSAAKEESQNTSSSKQTSQSVSFDTTGTGHVDASYSKSESSESNITHRNSRIMAGNGAITIKSTGDTRLKGANVEGQDIAIDTGDGNLSIESLQNTSTARSDSKSLSAGMSMGTGTSGRFNLSQEGSKSDRKWVDHQSTILGSGSVSIKTKTLTNKGAVIANASRDEEGELQEIDDNLRVTAKELLVSDITDTDVTETNGASFGLSGTVASIGLRDKGYEKKQSTRSTIGNGMLIVAGETLDDHRREDMGLNISLADSQKMVTLKKTSGLNATMRIQTDEEKVAQTMGLIKDIGNNSRISAGRIMDASGDIIDMTFKTLDREIGLKEAAKYYGMKTDERQRALEHQKIHPENTDDINNVLADGTRTDAEVEQIIKDTASNIQISMGVQEKYIGETKIYDGTGTTFKGYHDPKTGDIGINVGDGGTNLNDGAEVWEVVTHEVAHQYGENEKWGHYRSDAAKESWLRENKYNRNKTKQSEISQIDWLNQQYNGVSSLIFENTLQSSQIKIFNPYDIRRGVVEKGDTLSRITLEINEFYDTNYSFQDIADINGIKDFDQIKIGDEIQVGTIDADGNIWKPPYKEGLVNRRYWKQLNDKQKKITHYHRQIFEDKDIPETSDNLKMNELKNWNFEGVAAAHNIGTKGNTDYRGRGGRSNQQVIYDVNGELVTSPENKGSYDYELATALNSFDHLVVDVEPWLEYGNSTQDTSTKEQRIKSMSDSFIGRVALFTLGY